jgi:outer membrane protein
MFLKITSTSSLSILLLCFSVNAQSMLTAREAVAIALKNNFGILVAGNAYKISRANNTAGNAGMLPTIAANGSGGYSQGSLLQKPAAGAETHYANAESNTVAAGVDLNWTLFDGGKMFITKSKLNEIESLNNVQYRNKVQNSILAVISAYYNIVRQKQELNLLNDVISYNTDRVTIVRTSFTAGLSPKTTYLQAQIDLNVNKGNALNQKNVITLSKRTLNQLLARDAAIDYDVFDSIPLDSALDTTRINEKLSERNTDLLALKKQVEVAKLTLSECRTLRYPRLNLAAGYGFLLTGNTAGSPLYSRKYGPSVGASVSVPLYQGGAIGRQITIAELSLESALYSLEDAQLQAVMQARNAIDEFNTQRQMLLLETENAGLAKENLDISMQRLRLGQSTSLELKQAQESYEQSRTRLLNLQYNVKIAETKLKQLLAEL